MRRGLLLVLGCMTVAGCDGVTKVGDVAEGARIRTEQMADASEAASNEREARIFAQAAQMRRVDPNRDQPRYELRKDGAGDDWTIYDRRTGQPALVGQQVQTGLHRTQAEGTLSRLQGDDDQP